MADFYRGIDTVMKKTAPKWWYENKKRTVFENAKKQLVQS